MTQRINKAKSIIPLIASHGKDLPVGNLDLLITDSACRCKFKHVERVMYFSRPTDIAVNQRLLDTQLFSHITERHTPTDSVCAIWLILPQEKPEHCSSETGEYQDGYLYKGWRSSAAAALLPKVYLEQLSLLLLRLLHINVFVFLPVHKEARLKSVCASAAFLIAIGKSRCSCFCFFFFFIPHLCFCAEY